jgi:hypothetical protein
MKYVIRGFIALVALALAWPASALLVAVAVASGLFVAQARLDSAARVLHAGVAANRGGPVKHRQPLRLSRGVVPRSSVPLCSCLSAGVVSSDRAFAAARLARRRT